MLLLPLMLHHNSELSARKKEATAPKSLEGLSARQRSRGCWHLPSSHTSPHFGVNSEDICECRKQVPSCSGRPGTLTALLPTAKNVFQCNYRR